MDSREPAMSKFDGFAMDLDSSQEQNLLPCPKNGFGFGPNSGFAMDLVEPSHLDLVPNPKSGCHVVSL